MSMFKEAIDHVDLRFLLKQGVRFSPTIFSSIVEMLLMTLTSIFVIRLTQPVVYGELVIIITVVSLGTSAIGVRFGRTVLWLGSRYIAQNHESRLMALLIVTFLLDLATKIVIVLLLTVSGNWLMTVFIGESASMAAFHRYLWVPVCGIGTFTRSLPALYKRIHLDALSRILTALSRSCIIIYFAYRSAGQLIVLVHGHVAAAGASWLISLLIGAVVLKRQAIWGRPSFEGFDYRQMVRYSFHSFSQTILKNIGNKVGNLAVAFFLIPEHVAVYSVARRLASMVVGLFAPLRGLLQQRVTRLCESGKGSELRKLFKSISVVMALLALIGVLVFAICGRPLIETIFGMEYSDAYSLVLIMSIGYAAYACTFWNNPLSVGLNAPHLLTYANAIRVLVGVSFTLLLTYLTGVIGAAIALTGTLVSIVVSLTIMNMRELRHSSFR